MEFLLFIIVSVVFLLSLLPRQIIYNKIKMFIFGRFKYEFQQNTPDNSDNYFCIFDRKYERYITFENKKGIFKDNIQTAIDEHLEKCKLYEENDRLIKKHLKTINRNIK